MQVPISVPSSTDLESILSPDPIFSDLQLKEINYNAPGNTAWPPDYICINLISGFDSFKIPIGYVGFIVLIGLYNYFLTI